MPITLTPAWENALFGLVAKCVIHEAEAQNDWDVSRYWRAPIKEGTVPSGFIVAEKKNPPPRHTVDAFLTVEFVVSESGHISFQEGHYDQSWGDVVVDYHARCARRC